ncbi:unnamed protein product [Ixodes pacificus]
MNALVLNKKVFPALVTTYAHISLLPIINYAVKKCSTGDLQLGFVRRERNKHLVVHFLLRKEPFLRNKKKMPRSTCEQYKYMYTKCTHSHSHTQCAGKAVCTSQILSFYLIFHKS